MAQATAMTCARAGRPIARPTSTMTRALSICTRLRPATEATGPADPAGSAGGADWAITRTVDVTATDPAAATTGGRSSPYTDASTIPAAPIPQASAAAAATIPVDGNGNGGDGRRCAGPPHRCRPARWRPIL